MGIGESKEDYLEAVYILQLRDGYVRNSVLSNYMSYSRASVSVAMRGLEAQGYVKRKQAGGIELTEKGEKIAKEVYERHLLLKDFLEMIGVSPETADHDACKMEHAVSQETFLRLNQLMENLNEHIGKR